MEKSRVETFIGFLMRTGRYKTGMNSVKTLKRAEMVIVCESASMNTVKESVSVAKRLHCLTYRTKGKTLSELTHKDNVKILAVTDKDLAKAIKEEVGKDFIWESEEQY